MTNGCGRRFPALPAWVLLWVTALLAPAPGQADSFEPNDTAATATPLQNAVEIESWISTPEDLDWYTFTRAGWGMVQVRLHDLPADYDLILFARNPMTGEIESLEGWRSSNPGQVEEALSVDPPWLGPIYLLVFGYAGEHNGEVPYRLNVGWPAGSPSLPPSVTIVSPNGGESYDGGSTEAVFFTATDPDTPIGSLRARVLFSTNSGISWGEVDHGCSPSGGTCRWEVPSTRTTRGRIRVIVGDGYSETQDDSDGEFTILTQPPIVRLLTPNGGEILRSGDVETITYSATDRDTRAADLEINFEFSMDSGVTWYQIGSTPTENTGTESWLTYPFANTRHGRVKVIASDGQDHAEDISDADFTMTQVPYVYLSSPQGGVEWFAGTNHDIVYSATDGDTDAESLRVDFGFSTDGGTTWDPIAADQPNTGRYGWIVPDTPTREAMVKVGVSDGLHRIVERSRNFRITGYPAGQNTVTLPDSVVPAGRDIAVALELDNENSLKRLNAEILFDPTVVSFLGGTTVGRGNDMGYAESRPEEGKIRVNLGATGGGVLYPGAGPIVELRFRALADSGASTPLTPGEMTLLAPDGRRLRVAGVPGSITVTARPAPVLLMSLIRNPGRVRSFQIFVTAEGHLDMLSVVRDGEPVEMEEIPGRPGFYHGNVNLPPGTARAVVTADGAFGVHVGEVQATIEF